MNRKGFQLIEASLGVTLGSVALLSLLTLVESNARFARMNEQRAVARGALVELSEILAGEKLETVRGLAGSPSPGLAALLDKRFAALPDEAREQRRKELAPLRSKLSLTVSEKVGGHQDLVRMSLAAELPGTTVRLSRLFRDSARPVAAQH